MELTGDALKVAEALAKLEPEARFAAVDHAFPEGHALCKKLMAATGRLPAPPPPIEPIVPRQAPVLQALKQPLSDRAIMQPYPKSTEQLDFFVDHRRFADGTAKTEADTNMTQDGTLGYPTEFDLRWLELHFEEYPDSYTARTILSMMSFTFFFGCNTPWLRIPGAAWKPLIQFPDDDQPRDGEMATRLCKLLESKDGFWPSYWHPIGKKKPPRRIHSTESFRARMTFSFPVAVQQRVVLKVSMQDTLYTQL